MLKRLGIMSVMAFAMISAAQGGSTVSYQYDNAGRLRVAAYCSGIVAYTLDAAGNRITVNTTNNGGAVPAEDPNGTPDTLSFPSSNVPVTAGQTLQIEVDRLCPTATAFTATFTATGSAPPSDYTLSGSLTWAAGDTSVRYLTLVFTSTPTNGYEVVYIALQAPSTGALGLYPSYQVIYGSPTNTQPVNCVTNPALCS
jgi:hypothetical protein